MQRIYRPLIAAATLLLVVAACGDESKSAGGTTERPAELKVALCAGLKAINAEFMIAQQSGAFDRIAEDHNVRFTPVLNLSGPNCTTPLASGEIAIVGSALVTQVGYAGQGKVTTSFMQAFNGPVVQFMGASKYQSDRGPTADDSSIDWAAWDGAKIATTGTTTATGVVLKILEATHGVEFEEVVIPDLAAFAPALESGRIDGFIGDAGIVDPIMDGYGYTVVNFNSAEARELYGAIPPAGNFAALPETLAEHGEAIQAFVDALMDGLGTIRSKIDDPQAIKALLPEEFTQGRTDEKWELQWNAIKEGYATSTGGITAEDYRFALDTYAKSGIVKTGVTIPGEIVTNSFVKDYLDRNGAESDDLPATMEDVTIP